MRTNLDKIKEKVNNMSGKEIARYINIALEDCPSACDMCVYDRFKCKEDCNFGIEQWLKREEKTDV